MHISPYQKITYLKNYIGEKKLKQVGFIPCTTCPSLNTKQSFFILPDTNSLENTQSAYSPTSLIYKPNTVLATYASTIHCPECGLSYEKESDDTLRPLQPTLSEVEGELFKGFFLDLYL